MADEKESVLQTVKRNLTPEVDTSRSALPKDQRLSSDPTPQQEGEQLYDENFGSPAQQAYGKMKNWLSTHEQHFSDKVLKPFREGLDRMGDDLVEKGLDTHIPLLAATGAAMKAVPVGKDVKETAAALVAPPELGEEGVLSKELNKLSSEIHPTVEHIAASETEPAKAILSDATGKKIGQAKWTKQGDEAHLNAIAVDTPHVGHGKILLDEVANKAKESGAKGLTVGKVNSATPDAIGLFDRHKTHPVEKVETAVKGSQARRINFEPKVEKPVQTVEKTAERLPKVENLRLPPERTTGEFDDPIKKGGAIPGGIQKGDAELKIKDLALFHDPATGSTLALPVDRITPENVTKELKKSRDVYLAAEDRKAAEKASGTAEKMKSEAKAKGSADL